MKCCEAGKERKTRVARGRYSQISLGSALDCELSSSHLYEEKQCALTKLLGKHLKNKPNFTPL